MFRKKYNFLKHPICDGGLNLCSLLTSDLQDIASNSVLKPAVLSPVHQQVTQRNYDRHLKNTLQSRPKHDRKCSLATVLKKSINIKCETQRQTEEIRRNSFPSRRYSQNVSDLILFGSLVFVRLKSSDWFAIMRRSMPM